MADRITTLPSGVIGHILTCLPFNEAVRTSILSREWRYKWTNIPHVVFDRTLQQQLSENHDLESVVDHTLLKHDGGIIKFTLKLSDDKIYPINVWLLLLLLNPIEILELEFSALCPLRLLPDDLFRLRHLKHLYIKFGKIKLPSSYEGFSRIARLKLINVKIELGELVTLLSKCPKLESVELELFQLDGWQNEPPSELNHVTSLRLYSIDFRCLDFATWVLKLLGSFPDLQRLEIKVNSNLISIFNFSFILYFNYHC